MLTLKSLGTGAKAAAQRLSLESRLGTQPVPWAGTYGRAPMKNLVVIPCYNEEESLPKTLASLDILPSEYEILVINDGSTDRTGETADRVAQQHGQKTHVIHLPSNCGIGVAMQTGFLFAAKHGGFQYVIQFDGDGQHDATYVSKLVRACEEQQLDLCVGSRFLMEKGETFQSTFLRRLGIRFFAWLIGMLSGVRVTDPTSGFRCAGPNAWSSFAKAYPEDYPEPEALFWCARNNLRVGEIPVRMYVRQGGITSIRYLKTFYYMLKVSLAILVDRLRAKELEPR